MAPAQKQSRTKTKVSDQLITMDAQASDEDIELREKEFSKSNDSIGLRVQQGRLTLLSRKIFNVLVYRAQQLAEPGKGAPTNIKSADKYFWVPLSEVAADANYDSKDTELFKRQIDELQDVRVYHEDQIAWTSERLLASVKLVKPDARRKNSTHQVMLGYMFPPEVEAMVLKPHQYTKLSLYYQGQFRRGASLALYEICKRYITNPSKVTRRNLWQWWYTFLTGSIEDTENVQYKYFKRDVVNPAITEINSTSDINVELVEFRSGRRVKELQFKVLPAKQFALPFSTPAILDAGLLEKMMELGISQQEASDLMAEFTIVQIDEALIVTHKRQKNTKLDPIQSPAAYFKKALKNGYASVATLEAKANAALTNSSSPRKLKTDSKKLLAELKTEYRLAQATDALEMHAEMSHEEQQANIAEFFESKEYRSLPAAAKKSIVNNKPSPVGLSTFGMFLSKKFWPEEPSSQELYEFAAANLLIKNGGGSDEGNAEKGK